MNYNLKLNNMKTKNNPIIAKIEVSYDYDASMMNFEESFKSSPLFSNNNRGGNVFQYIDHGNIKLLDNVKDLFTIKTKSRHILYKFINWLDEDERKNYTVKELHEEIFSYYDFGDLEYFSENQIDNIKIERNYELRETKGYSQGDWAYVLIPIAELKKVWGNDSVSISNQYINNLFWDTPIFVRVNIITKEGQDYEFEMYDIDDIPEYLNYPEDIDFVNEKILKFIKKRFKNAPALKNIIKAIKSAFPDKIN